MGWLLAFCFCLFSHVCIIFFYSFYIQVPIRLSRIVHLSMYLNHLRDILVYWSSQISLHRHQVLFFCEVFISFVSPSTLIWEGDVCVYGVCNQFISLTFYNRTIMFNTPTYCTYLSPDTAAKFYLLLTTCSRDGFTLATLLQPFEYVAKPWLLTQSNHVLPNANDASHRHYKEKCSRR